MTRFVDVRKMIRWSAARGPERIIADLIGYLEDDFRRWPSFDKTPRVASHTPFGVIEPMPSCDNETYGFKYIPSSRGSLCGTRLAHRSASLTSFLPADSCCRETPISAPG